VDAGVQERQDSSKPLRGQGSASTVSSQAIGGEMLHVRRRIKLELLFLFFIVLEYIVYCYIRLCSNLLTPQ
jgi:hypothetical protein